MNEKEFFAKLERGVGITRSSERRKPPVVRMGAAGAVIAIAVSSATVTANPPPITPPITIPSRGSAGIDIAMEKLPRVSARIRSLSSLAAGWDGPASLSPSQRATATALQLVREFALFATGTQTAEPQVAPLAQGGYQFEWRHKDKELIVSCDHTGQIEILESGPDHELEYQASVDVLKKALKWLLHG